MVLPKLVLTDIDGVWTDGGMYYDQTGNEWKRFNTSDSAGVMFLKRLDVPLAIITGEETEIVKRRAQKLKIDWVYQGIQRKLDVALDICKHLGISLSEVAFIGDDIGDWPLLQKVGFGASSANAPNYIQESVDFVTQKAGGEGAFREFVEEILKRSDKLDDTLAFYR